MNFSDLQSGDVIKYFDKEATFGYRLVLGDRYMGKNNYTTIDDSPKLTLLEVWRNPDKVLGEVDFFNISEKPGNYKKIYSREETVKVTISSISYHIPKNDLDKVNDLLERLSV